MLFNRAASIMWILYIMLFIPLKNYQTEELSFSL